MRECWVIEEHDTEMDEWVTVEAHARRYDAETNLRRWLSDYKHRVLRYVPADTVTPMEWQPIETAPKDGTRVLLWENGVWIGAWSNDAQTGGFHEAPAWQVFECEDPFYSHALESPTHWMPFPAPPQEDREP